MLRNKGAPESMMGSKHSIAEEVTGENVNEPPSEGVEGGWREFGYNQVFAAQSTRTAG